MGDKNRKPTIDVNATKAFSFFDGEKTVRVEGPAYIIQQYQSLAGSLGCLAQSKYYLISVREPKTEIPVELEYLITKTAKTIMDMIEKDLTAQLIKSVI